METKITSATREVIIGGDRPTALIGERINPSGKKKLGEALKEGNLDIVRQEAKAQTEAGADILDVNVNIFGIDEPDLLPKAVKAVMDSSELPLCIDSANPEALEAAIKVYKGKPLVNSVTGEEHSLAKILPVIKKHGTAVVGLVQDDNGIPKTPEARLAVAKKIVERAEKLGIPREDIVIDCLCLAVGAETTSGTTALGTIRLIKQELGVNMTLAVSNISFGMPDRDLLNNAFVAACIAAGITCVIVDVKKIRPAVLAADVLMNHDKHARRYMESYRQRQQEQAQK
ncbi:MAG: pterin-binding protein [Chloroflexi bacterium RBG_13_56_8b]|nr:MAG: pterin-binding protein [Chloroflexi bacterium RBG_13_56_8b]